MSQLAAESTESGTACAGVFGENCGLPFPPLARYAARGPTERETSYNQFSDAVYRLPEDVTEQIGEWYRGRAYIYDNAVDDEDAALLDHGRTGSMPLRINLVCIDNLA